MYRGMKVAVVVPARNEERLIGKTIWPVPDIIDTIYVIDDGSQDRTGEVVQHYAASDARIRLIIHKINRGVGAAIITGYRQAHKDGHDVFVVVGGDAQMDWLDLDNLLQPISEGTADYTKGNRFIYGCKNTPGNAWREMSTRRILGNVSCSILTKFASGYYHINDSQMGYTALHKRAFRRVNWKLARKGYGYPAEWLMRFHSEGVRVSDVPVRAIYLKNERQTQIRVRKFLFYMMGIIVKGGLERLNREYMPGKVSLPTISMPMIGVQIGNFFKHLNLRIRSMRVLKRLPRVSSVRQQLDRIGSMRVLKRLPRVSSFRQQLGRIGSMRVLSRLSGVSSVRHQLGRVRSLPEVLSQRISLEKKLNPNQEAPSLDMYGGQAKIKPIDFDIGTKANRILRKATRFVFDSTLQGEQSSNSLEDLRVRFEKVSKTIRFHLTKEDSNQSSKSF